MREEEEGVWCRATRTGPIKKLVGAMDRDTEWWWIAKQARRDRPLDT